MVDIAVPGWRPLLEASYSDMERNKTAKTSVVPVAQIRLSDCLFWTFFFCFVRAIYLQSLCKSLGENARAPPPHHAAAQIHLLHNHH